MTPTGSWQVPEPATRVADQDWSTLTIEAFPSRQAGTTRRVLHDSGGGARPDLVLSTYVTLISLCILI